MRKQPIYAAVLAVIILTSLSGIINAQYLLATHKKVYEPTDSIEFYYIYPLKHDWVSLFLTVKPLGPKGGRLTAAADLGVPGHDKQVYHASRFGPGKFQMTLTAMKDNIGTVMVENEFEIRKERKKYFVGTFELEDDEQKSRLSALRKIVREKTPPYEAALKKYNSAIVRLDQVEIQIAKLNKERNTLITKIARTSKKIADDEIRRERVKQIAEIFKSGVTPGQTSRLTSERDSLQKIIDDNRGNVNAAQVEFDNANKSLQLTETKIKNLTGRPLTSINEELEIAKDQLAIANEELRKAEVEYYENKSLSAIKEIKISSDGKIVYQATLNQSPDQLLRKLLNDLKADSVKAAEAKKKAYDLFINAKKEEIEAGRKLGGMTGVIMKTAYKTAAIEGVFHTADLWQAWSKGGPVGFFAEGAKKLSEAYLQGELSTSGTFKPGTIEAELFREYDVIVIDPHRPDEITAHIQEVLANEQKQNMPKELGQAAGKSLISWIAEKIEDRAKAALKTEEVLSVTNKWAEFGGSQVNAGVGWAKDKLKTALIEWAKSSEQKAWMDYILKGRKSRFLFAPYVVAVNNYRKVDSLYHLVLANYAAYVNNVTTEKTDPINVVVNEPFYEDDKLQLTVIMKNEIPGYKDRFVLGGSEAQYQSPHRFSKLIGTDLLEETPGKVRLNLFLFKNPMNGWNPSSYQQ